MYRLIQGNNIDVLKQFPDNHFDSIVTDPPYGIDFLGKSWDANTGALETYQECLRVLKPGGHILAFSAARTYHHLAITLEQAGFEIRDQIMWIYSSGFPKSQDVGRTIQRGLGVKETKKIKNTTLRSKQKLLDHNELKGDLYINGEEQVVITDPLAQQWAGWGTALKPAHEPIALARKPIKTSIAKNVQIHGTGALNIDATRVQERFPSNVIGEIEEQYQKYFYCPKVSRKERHMGYDLDKVPVVEHNDPATIHLHPLWDPSIGKNVYRLKKKILEQEGLADRGRPGDFFSNNISDYGHNKPKNGNNHPTVKPVALMEYLIKLVTPPNGLVLDPFNGSGSTGMAAVGLGFDYVGIDLDPHYIEISKKRIEAWDREKNPTMFRKFFNNVAE